MKTLLTLVFALLLTVVPLAVSEDARPLHRERIEWCDIWFTDAEKDALPRVLLIGDSITRGYFDGVEKALAGKAYCGRLTTSRSLCDPVFFQELALVLGQYDFEVIHFNNGLHGWDYTEVEYRAGFKQLIATLKTQAPQARLICALSTPVQSAGGMAEQARRVADRNAIASACCTEADIPLNDLYAIAQDEHFTGDGVHFNNAGKTAQTDQVAHKISFALDEK